MELFASLATQLVAVYRSVGDVPEPRQADQIINELSNDALFAAYEEGVAFSHAFNRILLTMSGIIARRSTRDAGHAGLAQSHGFRSPEALIQKVTGASLTESFRETRVARSLLETAEATRTAQERLAWISDAGPGGAEPGTTEPGEAGPVEADPSEAEPSEGERGDAGRAEASDGEAERAEIERIKAAKAEAERAEAARLLWHAPLGHAVLSGTLTREQHDAIREGLGEPLRPNGAQVDDTVTGDDSVTPTGSDNDTTDDSAHDEADNASHARTAEAEAYRAAWTHAAECLVVEAGHRTLEELRKAARIVRDELDPEGALARYSERYEARSFRMWQDRTGTHRGEFRFDDEAAKWVQGILDAALMPRRGGPRFVDPAEQVKAQVLIDDPRTNDQLTHDLMIDVLRAGTLADAASVFGARQAGVRVVTIVDTPMPVDVARDSGHGTSGTTPGTTPGAPGAPGAPGTSGTSGTPGIASGAQPAQRTFFEADGSPAPQGVAGRVTCETGAVSVTSKRDGTPLDVGREQRLYTAKQRIALSLRDGGCRWPDCDRPASYCEAHHIDEWVKDQGRTDVDRGILICRFHHMQLHANRWRITRVGSGPFVLHAPTGEALELPNRLTRQYAWGRITPPTSRFRPSVGNTDPTVAAPYSAASTPSKQPVSRQSQGPRPNNEPTQPGAPEPGAPQASASPSGGPEPCASQPQTPQLRTLQPGTSLPRPPEIRGDQSPGRELPSTSRIIPGSPGAARSTIFAPHKRPGLRSKEETEPD